jgi:hypothetical protein
LRCSSLVTRPTFYQSAGNISGHTGYEDTNGRYMRQDLTRQKDPGYILVLFSFSSFFSRTMPCRPPESQPPFEAHVLANLIKIACLNPTTARCTVSLIVEQKIISGFPLVSPCNVVQHGPFGLGQAALASRPKVGILIQGSS